MKFSRGLTRLTLSITILALVFGLLGAKLFDIFENWTDFLQNPASYLLSPSGLTFYGGLICAAIAIILYARKHKIPVVHLADAIAPVLIIAYAIGRIGCHVAGDGDWGIVNNNPKPFNWLPDWLWAFNYPHNVNEMGVPIPGCEGRFCNQLPENHYPTPIYETIMGFVIFFILWGLRKRMRPYGALFALYLILNGVERFLIEKIRVNNRIDFLGFQLFGAWLPFMLLLKSHVCLVGFVVGADLILGQANQAALFCQSL